MECTDLRSIDLPNSIETILTKAFYKSGLEEACLPDNVRLLGEESFRDCLNLQKVKTGSALGEIREGAFRGCKQLKEVTIGSNANNISSYAFYDCDALTEIEIPNSVTNLGTYIFADCEMLEKVKLGTGITEIPGYSFYLCPSVNDVVIPYRVTEIGGNSFSNCTGLTSMTIPRSVNAIGDNAFSYPAKMTIYGVPGTYAEKYADAKGIKFVSNEVPATEVKFDQETINMNRNATAQLVMTVTPVNFTDEVTWKTSDASVVTVDNTGKLTAKAVGSATIRVTVGSKSASCKVTVVQTVTGIALNSNSLKMEALETFGLIATISPFNAYDTSVSWSSSDETIASVDENGVVTAHKKGNANITVTARDGSNISRTCIVTVVNNGKACTEVGELESLHNYENGCKDFIIYTLEGAGKLFVTFDERTNLEEDFDYLLIFDKGGKQVGKYTGTQLAGKTIEVEGDTIKLQMQTDAAGNEWGFKVISVEKENEHEVVPSDGVKYGDVNGDSSVNRADRMYLARAIAGWEGYELPSCEVADFNGDGVVNRADRMYLARAIAGWEGYNI